MPKLTGAIFAAKQGLVLPDGYIEKVAKAFSNATGVCALTKAGLQLSKRAASVDVQRLKDTAAYFQEKGEPVVFFLGAGEGLEKDHVPPYSILSNDKGETILAAFLEGDFPAFAGGSAPDVWNACFQYLSVKAAKLWLDSDNDLKEVMEELKTPFVTREITNMFKARGMITLMAATGEIQSYKAADDKFFGDFENFWTSNVLDYKEGSFPAKAEETPVKPSDGNPLDDLLGDSAPAAVPIRDPVDKPVDKPAAAPVVPLDQPVGAPPAPEGYTYMKVKPPANVSGRKNLKKWFRDNTWNKTIPGSSDLDNRSAAWCLVKKEAKVPDTAMSTAIQKAADKAAEKPVLQQKDTTPKHIPQIAGTEAIQPTVPTMTDKQREQMLKLLTSDWMVVEKGQYRMDQSIREKEEKFPTFSALTGLTEGLDFFDDAPFKAFQKIVGESAPQAVAMLLFALRNDRKEFKAKLLAQKPVVVPEPIVEAPKKVASGGGGRSTLDDLMG